MLWSLLLATTSVVLAIPYSVTKYIDGNNTLFNRIVDENSKEWVFPETKEWSFYNGDKVNVTEYPFFNCSAPLEYTGLSLTELNPPDIRDFTAVAALGDSLTAAFGAKATSVLNLFTDYRAVSWSGGGTGYFTFPNILKNLYNPKIVGFALGPGDAESHNAQFNDAITGGTVYDLSREIDILVNKIKNSNADRNGWLMINIMIGANDLCAGYDPKNYYKHLSEGLEKLHNNFMMNLNTQFKGVYINLVSPPNVVEIDKLNTFWCSLLHSYECPKASSDPGLLEKYHTEYNQVLRQIQYEYTKKYIDFYVVHQPFLQKTHIPMKNGEPDWSYWSVDCFHFSQKAHEAATLALFNNVFEMIGNKTDRWIPHEPIICPKRTILPIPI